MRQRRATSANVLLGRNTDGSRSVTIEVLVGSRFFLRFHFYPSRWRGICGFDSSISSSFGVPLC